MCHTNKLCQKLIIIVVKHDLNFKNLCKKYNFRMTYWRQNCLRIYHQHVQEIQAAPNLSVIYSAALTPSHMKQIHESDMQEVLTALELQTSARHIVKSFCSD
jgi:hypothetical protein